MAHLLLISGSRDRHLLDDGRFDTAFVERSERVAEARPWTRPTPRTSQRLAASTTSRRKHPLRRRRQRRERLADVGGAGRGARRNRCAATALAGGGVARASRRLVGRYAQAVDLLVGGNPRSSDHLVAGRPQPPRHLVGCIAAAGVASSQPAVAAPSGGSQLGAVAPLPRWQPGAPAPRGRLRAGAGRRSRQRGNRRATPLRRSRRTVAAGSRRRSRCWPSVTIRGPVPRSGPCAARVGNLRGGRTGPRARRPNCATSSPTDCSSPPPSQSSWCHTARCCCCRGATRCRSARRWRRPRPRQPDCRLRRPRRR